MTNAQITRKARSIENRLAKLFAEANALGEGAPDDEIAVLASNLGQWISQAMNEASDIRSHLNGEWS